MNSFSEYIKLPVSMQHQFNQNGKKCQSIQYFFAHKRHAGIFFFTDTTVHKTHCTA